MSHADLIQEQQEDPALSNLFQQVQPAEEVQSVVHGYFLEECMLVGKWLPQGEKFVGDAIVQALVSTKPRDGILRTAHDMVTGHVGVKKTYDKIFWYFYLPQL